ncbi:hypothetical protein ACFWUP_06975 [Nocardia sp. NPDC058658]|uniref:hypothetical protein n=1 Tax=Nocardia sp. NPDC058658 TaxID=3346580 RepID=UPI003654C1DA
MQVTDPAVQLVGMSPVIAASAGYSAQTKIVGVWQSSPYAPLLGRLAAAIIWGCGGVAGLTVIGIPAAITVPIALTVLTVVLVMLAAAFASGMIRPRPAGT